MNHQGDELARRVRRAQDDAADPGVTVAIGSGKGGVGKTALAVNLGAEIAARGERAAIVDTDLGLANAGMLLGLPHGEAPPGTGPVVSAGAGLDLLPARSERLEALRTSETERARLAGAVSDLAPGRAAVLVDLPAGIGPLAVDLALSAELRVVVLTPEPTALADAYAMVRILAYAGAGPIAFVVNRVSDLDSGVRTARRFRSLVRRFLGRDASLLGLCPEDPQLGRSIAALEPLVRRAPSAPAAHAVARMARKLLSARAAGARGQVLVAGSAPTR